ncbi:IS1634 family transposase [Geodermatophilus marinus]|uniref:IS1634 family transposase n=1 Tax=Geodermatophilus sp. LHW52908 TaxID=2303986 RepID=UPI0018F7A7FE|nr:IS1634 family transposase [Geodermatophilus sp. LHW52908]
MYLRTSSRQNQDGTTVRYVSIAHNERSPGGPSVAKVLLPLGREDRLDVAGLRRLVGSINRYLGDDAGSDAGVQVGAQPGGGLRITDSRPAGGAWLLDGLWQQLGIGTALREVLGDRRFTTDVERMLFALVANRALAPTSKLAAAEWISSDVAIPGLAEATDDQAYRAMDLLIEADTDAKVQEAVFFAVANLLNLEVDLLFFDTTSTYFERDTEDTPVPDTAPVAGAEAGAKDAADSGGGSGFRRYGHSKDSRPDLPQIIIGLAVTREGIPVRVWCWPGNTSDQAVLPQVKDDLRAWRLGRVVTVVDRGFSSAANLDYLRRAGGHFIAGERMRAGTPHVEEVLARQGRYRQVRDNLRVKEVRLESAPDLRWVLCANPDEATRAAAQREAALTRIREELARITMARARLATTKPTTAAATRRRGAELAAHTRAECALRDHPALGRWLRQTSSGRLVVDTAKVRAEARLDGKYLLVTSDPDLSAEDVALGYKNLLEAERGFRDLKSTLELRPVFHRLEPRIRAHVLLCWLALLLIRVAERRTGQTWPALARELGRLHAVTLTGPTGTVTQTTELTTGQSGILRACAVAPPPRITALHPA